MEEDIKILEELINNYRDCGIGDFPESVIEFGLNKKEVKAIINLIARNKELERVNNAVNRKVYRLLDDNMELLRKDGNSDKLNYKYPTKIQKESLPYALQGKDIIGFKLNMEDKKNEIRVHLKENMEDDFSSLYTILNKYSNHTVNIFV